MLTRSLMRCAPALLVLAACDLPNPAGSLPIAPPSPSEPAVSSAAVVIGSYSVPTAMPKPGMTNYSPHSPSGLELPANTYVLVRIGGMLRGERNPYLLGTSPGDGPISYTAVESFASTGRGATHVWLHPGGAYPPPSGGENLSRYIMPDAAGRDMIVLVRVGPVPAQVWTQREMMTGAYLPGYYCFADAPYCREDVDIAWPGSGVNQWLENHWVTESHTVTAMTVPEPLAVAGPEFVAPGGTGTFTASPSLSELRLRDRNGQPSPFFWLWYPNDTTAVPPALNTPEIVCSGSLRTTCAFAPTKSGRMRVQTFVEGALVNVDRVVRVRNPQLELTCDRTSVERGASVSCRAEARPSGNLTEISWRFVPPAGPQVTESGIATWGGIMATGGRIEVSARLNNEPQLRTDTETMHVTPRSWSGMMPYPSVLPREEVDPSRFPLPPVTQTAQGYDVWTAGALGQYTYTIDWFGGFAPISSGPNKGYWFLRNPPVWAEPIVYLSGHLVPGHPFYEAQTGQRLGEGSPPSGYSGWCTKADMDILRDEIRDHEGSLAGPRLSHHEFNVSYTATNDPAPAVEGVVLFAPAVDFSTAADTEIGRAYLDALTAANTAAVHAPANLYQVPCKVHMP